MWRFVKYINRYSIYLGLALASQLSLAKTVCCSATSCVPHLSSASYLVRVRVRVKVRVRVRESEGWGSGSG